MISMMIEIIKRCVPPISKIPLVKQVGSLLAVRISYSNASRSSTTVTVQVLYRYCLTNKHNDSGLKPCRTLL
jgi:hypothetical protein